MFHLCSSDAVTVIGARKFIHPSLPSPILHRERLLTTLNQVVAPSSGGEDTIPGCKLILLCAPAGYGKTTLLADFAQQTSLHCCWYFLDQADNDKLIFLRNLLTSIQRCFPHFGLSLRSLLEIEDIAHIIQPTQLEYFETFIETLARAIQSEISERFLIMLCNYHEINKSQSINTLVRTLLQHLPSQCMLAIETRAVPDFEIAGLMVYRELCVLDSSALQFTAQEIQELAVLQGVQPLGDEEAARLASSFSGWIAGLLLGTRLGDKQLLHANAHMPDTQALSTVEVDKRHLFCYVANEVFKREQEVYHFLREASVLQQMTGPLCDALLAISNSVEYLHYAEQQGLFVTHTDDGTQRMYSCHEILRELLSHELRSQYPERFIALHRQAAVLMHDQRKYDQAIFHALEGGLEDLAVQLIGEIYKELLLKGHTETLMRWIDQLPEQIRATDPKILTILASIAVTAADHEQAQMLVTKASTLLARSPTLKTDVQLMTLQAEISLARGKALFFKGAYLDAQTICQQILTYLPVDKIALRAEAYHVLGLCACYLGDSTAGISYFHQALSVWGSCSINHYIAQTHAILATTYSSLGNFALAEHHISRALKYWESISDSWRFDGCNIVNDLICFGVIRQRQGLLAEAESILKRALTIARSSSASQGSIAYICARRGEAYALQYLGELYLEQGDYQLSLVVTEESLALARSLKDTPLINYCHYSLALTYALMGDTTTALFLLSKIDAQATPGERQRYDLTLGTIQIFQRQYAEASFYLSTVRTSLRMAGLKREYLQATLRLAVCYFELNQIDKAKQVLEEFSTVIDKQSDYEQVIWTELQRFPILSYLMKEHSQIACLEGLTNLETPSASSPLVVLTNSPALKIQAFGEPAVFLEGKLITSWRRARTMELFFLLLDKGTPMRKEQIITALWPHEDESSDQTLRVTVHYLRKAIGEKCLITHKGTYTLDLTTLYGANVWYDVALFQEHYKQALAAMKLSDEQSVKTAFSSMVELYQGDFVQSFYSNWCTSQREKLCMAYLEARRHLAQIAWNEEQFEEGIAHWQHMLAVDNCLEEAHYGLMRFYLRQGKRGLALRQYQRCREILSEELAIQPGPAIQNLYERLINATALRTNKQKSG